MGLERDPLLLVLLGPTGSGKTALSLELAQWFGGEILSCDSVAVYRGMEIGSARPTVAERARVPHHLLDLVAPTEAMTAGDWARAARAAARQVAEAGRLPIVTGGTGLYLRAMVEGLAPLPPRCPVVRERLSRIAEKGPADRLHRLLRRLDLAAAGRIHANDRPKLIRAIEIALLSGGSGLRASRDALTGFRLLRIGLDPPREELYARLNGRVEEMFEQGLLEETATLQRRWGEGAQALGALGYREAALVLAGTMTATEAVGAVQQGHRNYAKRQMTWFRREPEVHWLRGFGRDRAVGGKARELVEQAL